MQNEPVINRYNLEPGNKLVQLPLFPPPVQKIMDITMSERFLDDVIKVVKDGIKANQIKNFLLPLLFYKYLSDISNEPSTLSVDLVFPPEYCWEAVFNGQTGKATIGQTINEAICNIVRLNPKLEGILNITDYEDGDILALGKLVSTISFYQLNEAENLEFWTNTYEYLLRYLTTPTAKNGESLYTPRDIVSLMIGLIGPDPQGTFYDPSCGSGCLSSLVRCLNLGRSDLQQLKIMGQDKISLASAVTRMDLLFNPNVEIYNGDALHEPLYEKSGHIMQFDYVITNPPWNQSGYNNAFSKKTFAQRFHYGIPYGKKADWVWVQHVLASLKHTGKAILLLDLGALSRGSSKKALDSECEIRKKIIENDLIEAVVSLPRNLFYSTPAPCCLLLLSSNKSLDRKNTVLFIDALIAFKDRATGKRVGLKQEESQLILDAYSQWKTIEHFCRAVSLSEIASHAYDLRPILYASQELTISYRPFEVIEQELVEARQLRVSNDRRVVGHFPASSQEIAPLHAITDYISCLKRGQLNQKQYDLLIDAEENRQQELVLEMEKREVIAHQLFAFDAPKVPLEECARIYGGFTPNKKEREMIALEQVRIGIPWVKAGDLEQECVLEVKGKLLEFMISKDPSSSKAVRPVNSILLAIAGGVSTVGKVAILHTPAVINHAICCIQPDENLLDYNYLFCYLVYMRRRWERDLTGSRQNLSCQIVKNHAIPLPDIRRQREIVTTLQPSNEHIWTLKQEIIMLRQFLQEKS